MLQIGRTGAIVAGVFGAAFIGYCIYFDRKRRKAPDFKVKLRERKMSKKQKVDTLGRSRCTRESRDRGRRKQRQQDKANDSIGKLPDLKDVEAVQKFFLEEVQLGEELLARGDSEKGVDHLSNAVSVCGQPQQLLQVLQQTLPHQVFQMLIQRLPAVRQRFLAGLNAQNLVDDDVE
ncbi:mitochondrial import receptor subunit TOM20 homolog isoform X1 [Narcine bancroftii]|uniref:mitochondrial import receptor subunit TOM20 homolog isoform X1 n=1 Tax=Narcine bancroftii TaxID=1343680 RepID=UPI003831F744